MNDGLSDTRLRIENLLHRATGGRSQDNGDLGFEPAFLDFATQRIYPSRFRNGVAAPVHVLDGLPDEVVTHRTPTGRVFSTKATLVAGFVRNGYFYTRSAAARAAAQWPSDATSRGCG